MTSIRILALCALVGAGFAISTAQAAEIKDPAPPAMLDEKSVGAWVAQNIHGEGWVLVNFDAEGVRLATPEGVSLMSDGLVETDIRHELFTPIQLGAGIARSGLAHWAVDCAGKRFAVVRSIAYTHNNLIGEVTRRQGDRRLFQEPVASEVDTLDAVCEAIRTGKRLDGPLVAVKPAKPS
ncbi:hypothetical protein [Phenylobacterium sp.]|uniref:hypothetical protein n=1 Tax=Phenylobacterium sp. TaxID=1871053 RepID=UPI00356B4AEF